jgi:hypothetical protein
MVSVVDQTDVQILVRLLFGGHFHTLVDFDDLRPSLAIPVFLVDWLGID